jgi:hypothetical protein
MPDNDKTQAPVARDHMRSLSLSKARGIICTKDNSNGEIAQLRVRDTGTNILEFTCTKDDSNGEIAMSHKYR